MFMMGKSGQTWIRHHSAMYNTLHPMLQWSNTNIKLNLLKDHSDTFFLHQLENDTSTTTAIKYAFYFNKQSNGFTVHDLEYDDKLRKLVQPLATFDGSAFRHTQLDMNNKSAEDYNHK